MHAVELFRQEGPERYDMKCRACELCEHNGETIKSIDSIFYDYRYGGSTRRSDKHDARGSRGDPAPVVRKLVDSMFVYGNDTFDKETGQRVRQNPKSIPGAMNALFLPVAAAAYRHICATKGYNSDELHATSHFIEEW